MAVILSGSAPFVLFVNSVVLHTLILLSDSVDGSDVLRIGKFKLFYCDGVKRIVNNSSSLSKIHKEFIVIRRRG